MKVSRYSEILGIWKASAGKEVHWYNQVHWYKVEPCKSTNG